MHDVWSADTNLPASHTAHAVAPTPLNVPTSHEAHKVDDAAKEPASQYTHDKTLVAPGDGFTVRGGHAEHEESPAASANVPSGQY